MDWRRQAYLRHQQQRWLRPDAARWVRPDAARFLRPGTRPDTVYPALDQKYSEDQPRVPAGNSDGGQWTSGSGGSGRPRIRITRSTPDDEVGDSGAAVSPPSPSIDIGDISDIASEIDKLNLFDIKPRQRPSGSVRLAGKPPQRLPPIVVTPAKPPKRETPGIGHNGGPPLGDPPLIPTSAPKRSKQRSAVQREIATWIGRALRFGRRALVKIFRATMEAVPWLQPYWAQMETYRDPPKTLQELQQAVGSPRRGTEVHHRAEAGAMLLSGYSWAEINADENLVRIPALKHYEITGWYQTPNDEFGGMTPRQYLADKPLVERLKIGNDALIRFGVMKP